MRLVSSCVSGKADITQYTGLCWVLIHLKTTLGKSYVWLCWPACLILEILTHGVTILIIYICAFSKQGDTLNTV